MSVPEAAPYFDDLSVSGQHDIRRSRQVFSVKPEAVAKGMDQTADDQLGFGVLASDQRHLGAAGTSCHGPLDSASTCPG